ncbi:MAG: NRDE family protein [Dyella sp.]
MCLIAFTWNCHPRWRLLLIGNRDEYHARPSAPASRWDGGSPIIGGRDLEAGGTWLGVTDDGRVASVTNRRDARLVQHGLSRGLLPVEYLAGAADAQAFTRSLQTRAANFRPFNLLLFDPRQAYYLGNQPGPRAQLITPGVHGLSNADFNTPWPKTRQLMARLQGWIDERDDRNFEPLFAALAERAPAVDSELPDTGIGLELERWLSSAFIVGSDYGTRASTLVAIAHDGSGVLIERRFGPGGVALGESELAFGV